MKKNSLLLSLITAFAFLVSVNVSADPTVVPLQVGYEDPFTEQGGPHRGPVVPEVSIDSYTLFFITPCDGCLLRIINEDGCIEYSTVIPSGTTSLVLPSYLSGDYELQIISGSYIFYGWINL